MFRMFVQLLFLISTVGGFCQHIDVTAIPEAVLQPDIVNDEAKVTFDNAPFYIAYNPHNDLLYISDAGASQIRIFDKECNFLKNLGRFGQGPGEFNRPGGLAVNRRGDIIVRDGMNCRVQIFDINDQFISSFKMKGILSGGFQFITCTNRDDIITYTLRTAMSPTLFCVNSGDGREITQFGTWVSDEACTFPYIRNSNYFLCDTRGNTFCVFSEYPIIRRYDDQYNLSKEVYLDYFPCLRTRLKNWQKKNAKKTNDPNFYSGKAFVLWVSQDGDNLYVMFNADGPKPIYVFDKESLLPVSKITLEMPEKEVNPYMFRFFNCESEQYIYAFELLTFRLVRFRKN